MEIDQRTGLPVKPSIGYLPALMSHLKCSFGSGIFAVGFALKLIGMALGPPIIVLLCLLQLHCQHLLVKCGKEVAKNLSHKPDLAEVGEGCFEFGHKNVHKYKNHMKVFTNFILILSLTGAVCIFTVLAADSMQQLAVNLGFEEISIKIWVLLSFPPVLILASVLRNMLLVSYLSTIANILIFAGMACTLYVTTTDLPDEYTFVWIGDLEKLPRFISTVLVSFTLTPVVMPIYIESANPEVITTPLGILNVGTMLELTVTLAIGIFSYLKYGKDCLDSVTKNFDEGTMAQVAVITVGVSALLTIILLIYIVIEALFPIITKRWGPFNKPELVLFIFKLCYILFTFLLSWALPMFGPMVELVGALGSSMLVVLPTVFHLALSWETMDRLVKSKDILIFVFGVFVMCTGVISATINIIKRV